MVRSIILASVVAATAVMSPALAQAQGASPAFTDAQRAEMNKAIESFLMDNPQVIMNSVEQYRKNQESMDAKRFSEEIKTRQDDLKNDPATPVVGNKNGDVTLVEFFDYNCGYCKQAFRDLQKLIDEDKNLRVVLKEMPILSESSHTAARYALAAEKQGKYWEYHTALMTQAGPMNETRLESVGKNLGLDVSRLKKDANSADIRRAIENNVGLAREIGMTGTPAFVIGDEALRGHYGLDVMRRLIAQQRAPAADAAATASEKSDNKKAKQ